VKKTVQEKDGKYIVSVGYKTVGEKGRVSKVQIIDSYPEGLELVKGEIAINAPDVRIFES
jgi:hypothetical protein